MLVLLLVSACANSSLGRPDPVEDTCPYVGTWSLVDVQCGATGSFEAFFERYDDASLTVADSPTGCSVQVELVGGGCASTERWSVALDETDPTIGDLESGGIASCSPDGCSFDGATPCLLGTGAGASPVTLDLVEPELEVSGDLGSAGEGLACPLGLVATFVRSR